jgi:hypothetical protein
VIYVPGLDSLVAAVYAVLPPDAVSAPVVPDLAPEVPDLAAVEGGGPGLISDTLRCPDVVAACEGLTDRPAGVALNAGSPVALDSLSEVLPAFPAERVRALFVV